MNTIRSIWPYLASILMAFGLLFAAPGCGEGETTGPTAMPTVEITGGHSLDIGETLNLSATTTSGSDAAYTWSSSSNDVATVDEAGTVTAVTPGEAIITATGVDTGASGDHAVVVLPESTVTTTPFVTVTGNPVIVVGATGGLTATTSEGDDGSYTWSSSDETIATVDATGVVSGLNAGEATITATGDDTGASGELVVVVVQETPNYEKWVSSAHADTTAEAFVHWNEDDPPEIPTSCAKCHSTPGFLDWIGEDGSAVNSVDSAAPIGTVIHCGACHNETASEIEEVLFPSGVTVSDVGAEAVCMNCHQGRSSTDDVNQAITDAGDPAEDTPDMDLGFLNIHYYSAAATLNAGKVRGGYEYDGQVYDWRFRHVPELDTCVECHDAHSLEVRVDKCGQCHQGATTLDDLKNIRMMASLQQDYDGDGDLAEGIYYEMETLKTLLLTAIQTYTVELTFGDLCYDELAYPYWFQDTNQNGTCEADEAMFANRWQTWTPRLVKATYNYQVASKDPGAFAHNAKYQIQLMYDSIADIDSVLVTPVLPASAVRNDSGHFNGASEAARHWDEDEVVGQDCSRCHGGAEGFHFYLQYGVGLVDVEPDNGLDCATCHANFGTSFDLISVADVVFPSGISAPYPASNPSNICMTCHQGRVSKMDIDAAIAANVTTFQNVHYLPAASVKKGTEVKVGYEYDTKTYSGEWTFHGQCLTCHSATETLHTFLPEDNSFCTNGCHAPTPVLDIRTSLHPLDYDGDGNSTERLHDELQTIADDMFAQLQVVASGNGNPICYSSAAYPYFFNDTNNNGVCDGAEGIFPNRFQSFTGQLLKAAHNYQIFRTEPGAWAHNFDYMAQLLIDSFEDLGGDPVAAGFVRPAP